MSKPVLNADSRVSQANLLKAKTALVEGGLDAKSLRGIEAFLGKAMDEIKAGGSKGALWREFPTVMSFKQFATQMAAQLGDLEQATRPPPRFHGLPAPRSIAADAFPRSVGGVGFSLERGDDGQSFVKTVPVAVRTMRSMATRGGMGGTRNDQGGWDLRFNSGADVVGAKWVTKALDQVLRNGDARLQRLKDAGVDVSSPRELLVVKASDEDQPTILMNGAGAGAGGRRMWQPGGQQGVTIVCNDVQFLPFNDGSGGGMITMRKPVVYLYPTQVTDVTVAVHVDGEMLTEYPKSTGGKWTITASPDGELFDRATERRYPYLFWEATRANKVAVDPARAACVSDEDAARFLEDVAAKFALNDKERTDFVSYWLPALERNPLSMVQVLADDEYARWAELDVRPTPDTMIRLFMVFQRVDRRPALMPTTLDLAPRARAGFTVVEWGGTNLDEG